MSLAIPETINCDSLVSSFTWIYAYIQDFPDCLRNAIL